MKSPEEWVLLSQKARSSSIFPNCEPKWPSLTSYRFHHPPRKESSPLGHQRCTRKRTEEGRLPHRLPSPLQRDLVIEPTHLTIVVTMDKLTQVDDRVLPPERKRAVERSNGAHQMRRRVTEIQALRLTGPAIKESDIQTVMPWKSRDDHMPRG